MQIVESYNMYNYIDEYTKTDLSPTYYTLCFILELLKRATIPPRVYVSMLIKLTTLR